MDKRIVWIIYVLIVILLSIIYANMKSEDGDSILGDLIVMILLPWIAILFAYIFSVGIEKSKELKKYILICIILFCINNVILLFIFLFYPFLNL